jgi:multidrug efflux pump subunit AcrB
VNGATIYIRDVANVRDGYTPQVNMVVSNGIKAALLPVLKNGDASTLDVVSRVRKALPQIAATLPQDLQVKPLFDQSVFVSSALDGVMREGIIAASLTAVMILLFLGSWRSTLVVATSIPLFRAGFARDRPDHQHHDFGRPGIGRRHPGRRRDGGN